MQVHLKLKKRIDNSYPIIIKKGLAKKIPDYLKKHKIGIKYAIISDSKVKKLFGDQLKKLLKKHKIEAEIFSFKPGEKSKSMPVMEKLAEQMVKAGFDRRDAIIALGGGVTGDLAGYLAASYMRGIPYIHVPTTLLAMVDSSIGGKTGVDLNCGKNLMGAIYHPKAVLIDIDYLTNLPKRQIRNGMAEVIKYGVIKDKSLFQYIEKNLEKIINLDEKAITKIIKKSVEIKTAVVEKDERESGLRMILNYGHTYGHAIEKNSNYTLLHGFAISIGMVIANKMAVKAGFLKEEDAERIKNLLKATGLPVTIMKKPSKKDLLSDKKCFGNVVNFILPTKIGKVIIHPVKC